MQFYTIIAFLAASAVASPQIKRFPSMDEITVAEANNACGTNMEVNCCNKTKNGANGNALLSLLNDISLFQCSKLQLNVLSVANGLLNKECQASAACCQNSQSTATGGLINIAAPCIALSSLI